MVPVSYFEPIPDLREVNLEDRSLDLQADLKFELGAGFLVDAFAASREAKVDLTGLPSNHMYISNDAASYFGMIRRYRPRTIIEIGSGHSALLSERSCRALQLNTQIVSVEPFPIPELRQLAAEKPNVRHVEALVEKLDQATLDLIADLGEGDILFIDTSHVSVRGGDSNFIFCRILPLLKPGVVVHIHDIMLPYDYDRALYYGTGRFYTEQYLLAAMLCNTDRFSPLLSVYKCTVEDQASVLPDKKGAAFWMRRV